MVGMRDGIPPSCVIPVIGIYPQPCANSQAGNKREVVAMIVFKAAPFFDFPMTLIVPRLLHI
jgi:hypothetical protein